MVLAEVTTGILRGEFPFNYLGCPIFYMKKKKDFFQQLMDKIANKLQGWKGKLLSYGGRAVLIQHVLQNIPIHCLSVMNPPLNVLKTLQKALAQFLWSSRIGERGRHWVRWREVCLPKEEGGLGFEKLTDISMALFCKLWWNFKTTKSIWSEYMYNKYCKREHPSIAVWRTGASGSQVWKKILLARDLAEHLIVWQLRRGNVDIWLDNWTGQGELYSLIDGIWDFRDQYKQGNQLVKDGRWDEQTLIRLFKPDMAEHIMDMVAPPTAQGKDIPVWSLETQGRFTVRSAWHYVRDKRSNQ